MLPVTDAKDVACKRVINPCLQSAELNENVAVLEEIRETKETS